MLLSPPSPPTPYRFTPQSSSQPTASQSSRSPLSLINIPSNPHSSVGDYSYSPASDSSIPLSDTSPNSKTSAFFGSPFASSPPSSSSSQSITYLPKTAAFFSSPFADYPTPPPNQQSISRERPSSARSLTADFFSAEAFSSCPTSPPSLRSSTSNASLRTSVSRAPSPHDQPPTSFSDQGQDVDTTPVPKPQVPLLSRLFPSRYSSNVRRTDDNHLLPPRGFVTIEPPDDILVSPPATIERSDIPDVVPPHSVYTPGALVHPDGEEEPSYELVRQIGQGAFSLVWLARVSQGERRGTLVAVKMIPRAGDHDDPVMRKAARGERATFLREVDVLHYLTPARASLPLLFASFTQRTHHVLVLEYVAGGELLDVVNSDEQHAQLSETLLRRIWRELVSAVEWIHARLVVHRDIKLENILLTSNPFIAAPTEGNPLIKLTDFGLARKIDADDPWLSTRCGSESYAAPELLVASHTDEHALPALSRAPSDARGAYIGTVSAAASQPKLRIARTPGTYDGRETDAWALGVVLYALVTRALPFDPPAALDTPPKDAEMERARRRWLLRVVRGEWSWPAISQDPVDTLMSDGAAAESGELRGPDLVRITAVKNLVAKLLVSDPRSRARISALWDEPWMRYVPVPS
ncbi:kinase-like domain-containing protein [Russula dissimulans]|nr:kinase-like domain-containing protein [Russula dissimulans]